MRVLALDVGSSSVKAACWTGRAFAPAARAPFRTLFDGPRAEVDAAELRRAVVRAGKEAMTAAGGGGVNAVAFCAFSSGVVVADTSGKARHPIVTHADKRSIETAARLVRERPKRWWLTRTGNLPYAGGIGTSTLAHLRQEVPEIFKPPYRVGQVSTLVGWWLTGGTPREGRWVIDPSNAVFLGVYDLRRQGWSADVCDTVGIEPAALPDIRFADDLIGGLGRDVATAWGLAAGLPVIGGFIDTGATLLQTPLRAGQLVHSSGSTDVLALCVDRPSPAEGILTRPLGVGRVMPERWLAVRTIAAAGSGLLWLRETAFREVDDAAWDRILRAAQRAAGRGDLPSCRPTFSGERAAIEQPDGAAFGGLRLGTTREELAAALMRALAAESAESYRCLARIHPPGRTVHISGGASALADAMHAGWPRRHAFVRMTGETLRGLVLLAERVLADPKRSAGQA